MKPTRTALLALLYILYASRLEGEELYNGFIDGWHVTSWKNKSDIQYNYCTALRKYDNNLKFGFCLTTYGEFIFLIANENLKFRNSEKPIGSIRIDNKTHFNSLETSTKHTSIAF